MTMTPKYMPIVRPEKMSEADAQHLKEFLRANYSTYNKVREGAELPVITELEYMSADELLSFESGEFVGEVVIRIEGRGPKFAWRVHGLFPTYSYECGEECDDVQLVDACPYLAEAMFRARQAVELKGFVNLLEAECFMEHLEEVQDILTK